MRKQVPVEDVVHDKRSVRHRMLACWRSLEHHIEGTGTPATDSRNKLRYQISLHHESVLVIAQIRDVEIVIDSINARDESKSLVGPPRLDSSEEFRAHVYKGLARIPLGEGDVLIS